MKVERSGGGASFYIYEKQQKETDEKKSGSNIFAGDLVKNPFQSELEVKREQARKEAMRVVRTQFENDAKIDNDLRKRREKIAELKEEASAYDKSLQGMREMKGSLLEQFGVSENSEEHQDLLLMEKANKAKKEGRLGDLSEEELDRIANMGPLTDYQTAALAYDEVIEYYEGLKQEALDGIAEQSSIIGQTKLALLKNQGMIKAEKTAEGMEQAASKEIIGMLLEEAREHVDEEMEELREEAKKAAEKKREQEELLEKKKEDHATEDLVYNMQEMDQQQEQIQAELQEIVDKNKLLNEDLKGITVNETV
ncbi:MAG: hypothetical protein J6B10_09445 [Lachnospiraceae bacterium]|nr:hypothetical protein [Lachnospiraceae bacterium]